MARTAASNLPGSMGTSDDWNERYTPAALLGLMPGTGSKAAGHALPPTSAMYGDRHMVWYSPDSPAFWAAAFIGLAVLGMAGADVRVRLFKGRAGAGVGSA